MGVTHIKCLHIAVDGTQISTNPTMKQIALVLFLHITQAYVNIEECLIDNRSLKNVWEERLHDKLMCNYNSWLPPEPLNGSDSIVVSLRFIVKSFKFVSEKQEFSIFTWPYITWKDTRLKWNASNYEDIDETVMDSGKLWIPGIMPYNSISDSYADRYRYDPFMPCNVNSDGSVSCLSEIKFQAKCATDLNDWPFDTQVCSLEFGAWAVQRYRVRLDFGIKAVSFIGPGSLDGADWDIIDYSQEENQDAVRQLKIYFTIMRHTEMLAAIVIYPSILLSVLTLLTLFLDVRCTNRLFVACFSLACHFFFLSELAMDIPVHSKDSPRILLYFRGSVIMTMTSIVLTYLLKFLCEMEAPVPNFIAIANEYAYKTYGKYVFHPRWGVASDDVDKIVHVKAWTDFANMLNSIWIFVCLMIYVIMCCVFIPSPSGLKHKIRSKVFEFQ